MKFVIFKEKCFSDTHFINEMFEKSNFHEDYVQKIVMVNFKEYFSLLSLHPFLCKEFSLPRFFVCYPVYFKYAQFLVR